MRTFPISIGFFLATAVIFVLQTIPYTGIILLFMLAAYWSVPLVNAGMLGTACEALIGRISRWWLVFPVAFYGGYFAFSIADHQALRDLGARFVAKNSKVGIPFDPDTQALVFESNANDGGGFVENYRLPVVYSRDNNVPDGFLSTRMITQAECVEVRESPRLSAAGVYASGFFDGDDVASRKMESRFCDLSMPERPTLPQVTVVRHEQANHYGTLPITQTTTTVTAPTGQRVQLLGGFAAPLSWFPMPIVGCWPSSGGLEWQCGAAFWRTGFTPIVSGTGRFGRDSLTLARALGLKPVSIAYRQGGNVKLVRAKIAEIEAMTLARQLAAVDQMIADPIANVKHWQTEAIIGHPGVLAARANDIMIGLEGAAAVEGNGRRKARDSGLILADLIAHLPHDRLVTYGPRLLRLYHAKFQPDADDESHWLWEAQQLVRRLGDLGPAALLVAVNPRANEAGIEAMCRIGASGRQQSGPVLLNWWRKLDRFDRNKRGAVFVALRRVGITPPPIVESDEERSLRERANAAIGRAGKHQASLMDELMKEWGDISPASPPRVCSPNELRARQEEQYDGVRRSNLS